MSQADDTDTTTPPEGTAGSALTTKAPKFVTRRSVTTGLAAVATAIPAVGLCKSAKESLGEDPLQRLNRTPFRSEKHQ